MAEGQTEVLLPVDGDDLLLSVVPAPTFLGLMGVLEDAPRTAAIRAGTDLELVIFPRRVLAALDARGSGQLERFYRDALIYQARDLRSANSRVSHHYREKLAALGAAVERIQELYDQTLSVGRARERIVNHVSHELKTPLAIMAGSLRVVSDMLGASQPAQRVLGRFQRNLQRLHDIQRSMMDIYEAKVAPQGFDLPIEPVPVLSLLRQILDAANNEAQDRNVEVLLDAPADLAADVPLRPFGEALEGLIRNAVENTPDESRIVIKAHAKKTMCSP